MQSNMWLPLGNSFNRNKTLASIRAGTYTNMRGMIGNSGNGNSVVHTHTTLSALHVGYATCWPTRAGE